MDPFSAWDGIRAQRRAGTPEDRECVAHPNFGGLSDERDYAVADAGAGGNPSRGPASEGGFDEFTAQFSQQRECYENTARFDSGPGGPPGQTAGIRKALKQA
ncbi:MAG: hypothetical protein OXI01_16905 [Albidovulum sp.]|nr:hypothetical protein [Albidovulum sp.]